MPRAIVDCSRQNFETGNPDVTLTDELASRRTELVEAGRHYPLERVASFLVFLAHDNGHCGRDASVIADDLRCGVVADLLHLSVDDLEGHLVSLQQLGLIRATETGALKLLDIGQLELLADGGFREIKEGA